MSTRAKNCVLTITIVLTVSVAGSVCADTTSSADAPFDPKLVVARVGNAELTLGQLRAVVEIGNMYRNNPQEDQKRRRDLLDRMIDDQLVSADAKSVSLKNNNGALARARRAVTLTAAGVYMQEVMSPKLQLDSATVDSFYNNHISRYSSPRNQRRARIITAWKEGKAPGKGMVEYHDSLYAGWYPEDKIDSIYTRLSDGEEFSTLAAVHSEDPITRGHGGDLGWVSEQSLGVGPVTERVMKQPIYMFSKPFETNEAWHIVQAVADRPAGPVPLDDEIRADIVTHLVEQQKDKMLKEMGDSLLAFAKIEWHAAYSTTPHDELKNEMVLAIVNGRDTVFAEEFLQEQFRWMERTTNALPDAARRGEILRTDYVRYVCWYGFMREQGYLERPEVVFRREQRLQEEREAIVRSRIVSGPFPEPDSAMIQEYYQDSIHLYGATPSALTLAWNSIKSKLSSDIRDDAHRRWRKGAYARHGVTRYGDRLAQLQFITPKPKGK